MGPSIPCTPGNTKLRAKRMNNIFIAIGFLLSVAGHSGADVLPDRLSETGLYSVQTVQIADDVIAFSPQYPLWSDGAKKRRWLYLPPGESIDASDVDAWVFPPGTKAWKEFGFGSPVETRLIEKLQDGSWRFSSYVWTEDGSDAMLAPAEGISRHRVEDAPGQRYPIPSREDCLACHDGGAGPLLGVTALQLSPDRDPLAPHGEILQPDQADMLVLHERGLLRNLPDEFLQHPPRIAAATPVGRAALGYLHGNCGTCHNDAGTLDTLDLVLLQKASNSAGSLARTLETTLHYPGETVSPGVSTRIKPGDAAASALFFRLHSRNPVTRMPPLGRRVPDQEAIALLQNWIDLDLTTDEEHQ